MALTCLCLLNGCQPVLWTRSAAGIGAFWDVDEREDVGVHAESFRGVGIIFVHGGLTIGWIDFVQATIDPERAASGELEIDGWRYLWGDAAENVGRTDHVPTLLLSRTNPEQP
ncbi:MAG: hypothetical protein KAI24_04595 [Planctomycetes bacterium]|nr:hypothetical protein [Planctomycetota bacterium]